MGVVSKVTVDGTAEKEESFRPALAAPLGHGECGSHSAGLRWYCGQAKPGQVMEARDQLIRQQFESLVPLVARISGNATVIKPLLGPYFLVRFDRSKPGWRRIVSTRGVARLFGTTPELPTPLRDADVEHLRTLRCDDFADPRPAGSGVKPGGAVRCVEGPHRGQAGVCIDLISATARCLLFTSSGPMDLDLPLRWVVRG